MNDIVVVRDLTKVFGRRGRKAQGLVAVSSVSFSVQAGGALGIVGESGSGKTTLSRMLVGLERPTSGSITICDQDRSKPARSLAAQRERARQIQIVFQDPYTSLDRRQTGADCLAEVLRLHSDLTATQRDHRIHELGDQVGLSKATLASRPAALSGGQRQRLAIARALAASPQVLVLDEAVSALDVSVQAQVLNRLADIREELGITYLFVSHDLAVIQQITDDVIVMRHGGIVERGSTKDVLTEPQHEYTKLLRDSVPRPGWTPAKPAH
ncbi:ABC-type glutathione transport system ATPase component [Kibdelosporangium banguiense]|uniref:ABC-type glutathione transport system ATPase component n=1 Tax=Kibdelosporangium banguiense TaxID=1365924 RepID=A0ABS4TS20_9PSEU|nr:ATP-binding cassette domain-containing protein [Kibdelosporangium banguiense]MBP2327205.1 ABC-type glutathione transport system ATPase component [Kibdelosporangium banguiense]